MVPTDLPRRVTIAPCGPFSLAAAASFGFGPNLGRPLPVGGRMRLAFVTDPLGLDLRIMNLLMEVLYFALPLTLVVSGTAVIVRFRRARGDERQQIKWFAYAVGVMVSLFLLWFSLALAGLAEVAALAEEREVDTEPTILARSPDASVSGRQTARDTRLEIVDHDLVVFQRRDERRFV